MSHCDTCGKLKRQICRHCQPQEYIDMLHKAMAEQAHPKQEAKMVKWNCPCGNTVTFHGFTEAPPPRQPLTNAQCEYCKRGLRTMCLCGIKGEA